MLKKLNLRKSYDGERCSLMKDFYIPALSCGSRYDRAVGFFSAYALAEAAQGISSLAKNDGKMRLIVGKPLDPEEYEAVKEGSTLKSIGRAMTNELQSILESSHTGLYQHRLDLLCWLTAVGKLEIKFAYRREGMFHQKIGIITDEVDDKLVFQGSANESLNALLPDKNDECLSVFFSWDEEVFREYGLPFERKFERLWENKSHNNVVIEIPSDAYALLRDRAPTNAAPDFKLERQLYEELVSNDPAEVEPHIPKVFGQQTFRLRPHQKQALLDWQTSSFSGIFEHATGSGKTITAIYGAVKIYEARGHLVLVVGVPYQALADQWCEVLRQFGLAPIRCYISVDKWRKNLLDAVMSFNTGAQKSICIVAVNATLLGENFQECLGQVKNLYTNEVGVFIGDECHHHASYGIIDKLPRWQYRIGLSATPFSLDEESNAALISYYGDVVTEYTLNDALDDGVLTPYKYHIVEAHLSETETEEYERLSASIAALENKKRKGKKFDQVLLQRIYMKRARLIGTASDKLCVLRKLLKKRTVENKTLFYCGDGYIESEDLEENRKNIYEVSAILAEFGWRASRFTAEEPIGIRREILQNFETDFIDALVAIRVLDEGIDIPGCRTAFIMASSRNPRQFIQRRGRILRKAPGKNIAEIFDFVILPPRDDPISLKNLVARELQRCSEFIRLCSNKNESRSLAKNIADRFDMDLDDIETSFESLQSNAEING